MKITLLNGNTFDNLNEYESGLHELSNRLRLKGMGVTVFNLREMEIHSCTGCWGCWVKTPGECLFRDDSEQIRKSAIQSDLLIFASPLVMGFTTALLKIMQDRLIPLLHPYIELVNNECHHVKRYDKYPRIGLIYHKEPDTDAEDIRIITGIYQRLALNFKSELLFSRSIDEPMEILVHEITGC